MLGAHAGGCAEVTGRGKERREDETGAGPRWGFNGNVDAPTFTPSVLVRYSWSDGPRVCHSFVTDGRIQFLGDCTHNLAGQTVDLPDWEDEQ